jgi:carnitine O-octanoyltransferase
MSSKSRTPTFINQDKLPSLPVPPLENTLNKYLESGKIKRRFRFDKISVQPHVDNAQFERTKRLLKEFGSGVGKVLNEELLKKAATSRNWVNGLI